MKVPKTPLLVLAVFCFGCRPAPVPPEIQEAKQQDRDLWKSGASVYLSREYDAYSQSLKAARKEFQTESLKLGWFRDYGRIRENFRNVLDEGATLSRKLEEFKRERKDGILEALGAIRKRIAILNDITLSVGERGEARQALTQAGVYLREAEGLTAKEKYAEASEKMTAAGGAVHEAEEAVLTYLGRYLDSSQVEIWKKWAEETIARSRKQGVLAIIISKLERRLTVYRRGIPIRTYGVGLGFEGLSTKMKSGDNATPEGKYRIIRKNPRSLYHKALLINYPNDADKKRFAQAIKEGVVPPGDAIGGDIEIHGGGRDSLTRGCISLDNDHMDEVYALATVGTPVTIIGTLELENFVIRAIRDR